MEDVEVASVTWEEKVRTCDSDLAEGRCLAEQGVPTYAPGSGCWFVTFSTGDTGRFAAIWCATGTKLCVRSDPLLRDTVAFAETEATKAAAAGVPRGETVMAPRLLEDCIPVVTPDCRLVPGLNLFVMGRYAGLELGPGAVNLMGARAGAARIARALRASHPGLVIDAHPASTAASAGATTKTDGEGGVRSGRKNRRKKG